MEQAQFEKANEIKYRIEQLMFLKQYMSKLFVGGRFDVVLNLKILNIESSTPIEFFQSMRNMGASKEDGDFIINSIDNRIKELEKQFNEL